MDPLIIAVIAVAPGIFWLWYFYAKDRYEPEPVRLIIKAFLFGMIVIVPVFIVELSLSLVVSEFVLLVAGAPIVEELAKYGVVKRYFYPDPEFDEPMDGIIYAIAVALGFATLENILYIFSACAGSGTECVTVGFLRALLSVPGHALFAGIWGYALGQAKFTGPRRGTALILQGLALGISLHAIFNFLLVTEVGFAILLLVLVPLMWWMLRRRIKRALGGSG